MGVIDPKNANALFDPELDDGLEFLPKRSPVRRVEFEGIYVLILLGRVLGILDCAVGPVTEPFRVLTGVRVIRRALIGEIECNVDATLSGRFDQPAEVVERAKFRMNGLVPALFSTDAPGAAGLSGFRLGRIVFALPE